MKINCSQYLSSVAILILTFAASSFAQQSDYEFVDLGPLAIMDMNDSGVLTGTHSTMNAYTQPAYIWDNGNLTYLTPEGTFRRGKAINNMGLVLVQTSETFYRCFDHMGSYTCEAFPGLNGVTKAMGIDVNDRGLMVGYTGVYTGASTDDPNNMPKPFMWIGNQVTPFLSSSFNWMNVAAVNENDQVVGTAGVKMQPKGKTTQITYTRYGYIFSNQVVTNLGKDVFPKAINNDGVIVGDYFPPTKKPHTQVPYRAFIRENGVLKEIQGFDALAVDKNSSLLLWTYADDINDSNQVVGAFAYTKTDGTHVRKAYYWDSSSGIVDLNTLLPLGSGWLLEDAYLINNQGAIVGYGKYNGELRRFLLKPIL